MSSQSPGTPPGTVSGQFRNSNLGVPGKSDIRAWVPRKITEYIIGSKVVAYFRVQAVVNQVSPIARGLSQHPSSGRGESSESNCPWLVPTPKGVPKCELTTLWFVLIHIQA
jgi:hypothetical protein